MPQFSKILKLTSEQQANLIAWRAEALEIMPYMASILLNLRPVNAPGLKTFACDPWFRLYIDFDEVIEWGPRMCAEALLHECCHLFAHDAERADEHGVKPNERDNYNAAADAANNDDLIDAGCTALEAFGAITPAILGAPYYMTAEFYFDFLKESGQSSKSPNGDTGGGSGDQQSDSDSGSGWSGCGSVSGGTKAPCELDQEDDANGKAPAANDAERAVADIATAAEIQEYAAKHPGKTPRGLVERAEQVLKPSEIGWRQVLSSAVRRAAASRLGDYDTTYSRRNRRQSSRVFGDGKLIQPGIESPIPRVVVVRDTSGSMTPGDLSSVTDEVEGIAKQLGVRDNNLIVLDVDAELAATRKYRKASDLEEIAGRGGTDMCVGIEAATALRPAPSAIVVITDGFTPWPTDKGRVPIVACIVGLGASDEHIMGRIPPFIQAVKVPEARS